MGLLELILIIFLVLLLFGGGVGYSRRGDWGYAPGGIVGVLFVIILVVLLVRLL